MKLKHLLALASLVIGGGNLCAQTDVTSQYITNAGFEGGQTQKVKTSASPYWNEPDNWTFSTSPATNAWHYASTTTDNKTEGNQSFQVRFNWASFTPELSQTLTDMPAGRYTLSADVKITKAGGSASIEATVKLNNTTSSTKSNGASDFTTHSVTVTLEETNNLPVTLVSKYTYSGNASSSIVCYWDNVKLYYTPFATSEDYSNLNAAIEEVESKAWGFDAGEYAPYNYVELFQALAAAKAVNQSANNLQPDVQTITANLNTALSNATFTANAEEVNAIFDGTFSSDYTAVEANNNNKQTKGWYRVKGTTLDGYNVRYVTSNGNAGLSAVGGYGMFTKFAAYYGWGDGYTMPLNASTYYTLSFKYGGWGDCKKNGYVAVTDPASASLSLITSNRLPVSSTDANSNAASWISYSAMFKTNDAGNYVLGLRKDNESEQSQYVYGDFVLKTTTVAEATAYYNTVKTDCENSYDAEANGGDEKAAFRAALDAAVPGTVAEIMEAAANLYTLRDAFTAAIPKYNAFETEKASAIAIGVTSEAANAVVMNTADGLQDALNALYVLEDAAATANYAVDATTLFGTWTAQKMDTKSGEHWSGDASRTYYDRWQNSGYTASITSTMTLPAGKYVFKVAGRAQAGGINGAFNMSVKIGETTTYKDFVAKNAEGYGIETSGVANYSEGGTYANTKGRGWEWRFIGFELSEETSVTMTAYAQILANNWVGFSDATLLTTSDNVAILKNLLSAELTTANAINTTVNVGTGAFQIPSSAVSTFEEAKTTAQGVYDDTDATSEQVSNAITALQTAEETYKNAELNAPDEKDAFNLYLVDGINKTVTFKAGNTTSGTYAIGYTEDAGSIYNQAIHFAKVEDNKYNLYIVDDQSKKHYLCTGTVYDGNDYQIRMTDDASKALAVEVIATTESGVYNLKNTITNALIGSNGDTGVYTAQKYKNFNINDAVQASVAVKVDEGKWGTRIFPFEVTSIPDGLEAYTATSINGSSVVLSDAMSSIPANTPVLLKATKDVDTSIQGYGVAKEVSYTEGLLTGVYTTATIPASSEYTTNYVLQTQEGTQAFYKVDAAFTATPYRCYLTVTSESPVKAFFLDFGGEDAINGIEAETENAEIFNLAGQRVNKAQRGIYIINGKKVLVK